MTEAFKTFFPYLVCFILGVLVCLMFRGCGGGETETVTIEKPVYKTEYVDRWKEKPVRFVETKVITRTDTVTLEKVVSRFDTLLLIDTVKIVEAWLTEVVHYDTTAPVGGGALRLRWHNYQNLTESLRIDYTPKKNPMNWALGVHANAGLLSDFRTEYRPLFGLGLQVSVKRTYIAANYGFNGKHYVGVGVGYNFIQR